MRRSLLFGCMWASLAAAVPTAQAPAVPTEPVIAIRAGHVVDVEAGSVRDNRVILVESGRIKSISAAPPPAGARVIDLSGSYGLPGLIDAHSHRPSGDRIYYRSGQGAVIDRQVANGTERQLVTPEINAFDMRISRDGSTLAVVGQAALTFVALQTGARASDMPIRKYPETNSGVANGPLTAARFSRQSSWPGPRSARRSYGR